MPDSIETRRAELMACASALAFYIAHSQALNGDVIESLVGAVLIIIGRAEIQGGKDGQEA